MRLAAPLLAGLALCSTAAAQVEVGELLVTEYSAQGELHHYRTDGTLVQSFSPASPRLFEGGNLLPDGSWVTLRNSPAPGLVIFDPVSATKTLDLDLDPGLFQAGNLADVGVRSDGTILIVDSGDAVFGKYGHVHRFDRAGTWLEKWTVGGGHPSAIVVDESDGMWLSFARTSAGAVEYYDIQGDKQLGWVTLFPVADLSLSAKGEVWSQEDDGWVERREVDGNPLAGFYSFSFASGAIAAMEDGTAWVGAWGESELRHYTGNGGLLGTLDLATPLLESVWTPLRTRIGLNYCPAELNSTGSAAEIVATGSVLVADSDLHLLAQDLPTNESGYYLNSPQEGFVANPGGSAGNLCLSSAIARHVDQVTTSGAAGAIHIEVDLNALPRPGGPHTVMAGETWYFQCWYRDGATSNFTDGVCITFL